jgi:cysteine-rich repeat protein
MAILITGCTDPKTITCANGDICPNGLLCDDAHGTCVLPEQLSVCLGQMSGDGCQFSATEGVCDRGVCIESVCGDGYRGPGEACDDGNVIDDETCSTDCSSTLACGNGILDAVTGEECDCGTDERNPDCVGTNSDTPGATCRSDCRLHCGDGEVNAAEECDSRPDHRGCLAFGFDRGALDCAQNCTNSYTDCSTFGFRLQSKPDVSIESIWSAQSGETFFAGSHFGMVGDDNPQVAPTTVYAIAGSSPNNVLIAAANQYNQYEADPNNAEWEWFEGFSRRYDGEQWIDTGPLPIPLPYDPGEVNVTMQVWDMWAGSPTDAVAVGTLAWNLPCLGCPRGSFGVIWSFDGTAWKVEDSYAGRMRGITQLGNDLLAIGSGNGTLYLARRTAGQWSTETSALPFGVNFYDVWAAHENFAVAVGDSGEIRHFDGNIWQTVPSPPAGILREVHGTSPSDVYAVADGGSLIHYDGAGWTVVDGLSAWTINDLASHNNNVVVSTSDPSRSSLLGREFPGWQYLELAERQGSHLIGGADGIVYSIDGGGLHKWDGAAMTVDVATGFGGATAMKVLDADTVLIANGTALTEVASGVPSVFDTLAETPVAIDAASSSQVFVALDRQALVGSIDASPDWTTRDIALADAGDSLVDLIQCGGTAFAASKNGELWRVTSAEASRVTDVEEELTAVWCSSDTTAVLGGRGAVWHVEGSIAARVDLETSEKILDIGGTGSGDAFAISASSIQHFNGTQWSPIRSLGTALGVYATASHLHLVSLDSRLRRLSRTGGW